MKSIFLLPPSPAASQGVENFPWPAPATHVILSTRAPRLVKAARSLPTLARRKRANDFPTIPVDGSHSFIVFALMFAAAAVTIYLGALAMLDLRCTMNEPDQRRGASIVAAASSPRERSGGGDAAGTSCDEGVAATRSRLPQSTGCARRTPRARQSAKPVARSARGTRM